MKAMDSQQQQHQSTQSRQKINTPSSLLTPEENEAVFRMLGRKCQTLNTAVVQIYKTEGSAHSHWKKKYTGVICFVKDSAIRSYFLRAYCLIKNELIWQHEIYDAMKIIKARPFLLTFEGQDGHVGLNFVSEEECDSFFTAVHNTIESRNRRKQERRNRPVAREQTKPPVPQNSTTTTDAVAPVQMRNHTKIGTVNLTPAAAAPTPAPTKSFLTSLTSSSNKDKKRKVTKADISQPTNFVHLTHVGWDLEKGFDLTGNENDEILNQFFQKAGVSESQLKDRDTRAFIYDFIETHKVVDSYKRETKVKPTAPAPPPVPSRHHHQQTHNGTMTSQRSAPPPPPPARQPPPPVPTAAATTTASRPPPPPTRPPPIPAVQTVAAPAVAPPPPPPPPPAAAMPPPPPPMPAANSLPTITTSHAPNEGKPPASSLPVVNDDRNALLDSIRKGVQLKKVDTSAHSTGSGDSRSELMSEIRQGIELRPAEKRELGANRTSDDGAGSDALADALRRALQERGRVIQSSDEESESSGNDDEWDD